MGAALETLTEVGSLYNGRHFVLKSGLHSEAYINPDVVLAYPWAIFTIAEVMATPFYEYAMDGDLVCVGPAFGGNYFAAAVSLSLSMMTGRHVRWVATRKIGSDSFEVEPDRGFERLLVGSDVLFVEDLLTTGGSVKRAINMLKGYCDFNLVGVTVAINRGGVSATDLEVPILHAAEEFNLETQPAESCRWCAEKRPIVEDAGHGDKYKLEHPDYPGGYVELLS